MENQSREQLTSARRLVIKAGSRVLVQRNGRPDPQRLKALVDQIATLHRQGLEVVLVSSGAVGAGLEALGWKTRPTTLPDLQMAAAVGQTRLMTRYDQLFAEQKCRIGQVLLTHDALKDRLRHLNARNTMMNLLRNRIIPVVNENDAVSTDEIKFGDNDVLASLVAMLIGADALLLLTTTDGLREPVTGNRTRRVSFLEHVSGETLALVNGKDSHLSTGGMGSKLQAASMAADTGIPVVIADGRKAGTVLDVFAGKDTGTLLAANQKKRSLSSRKRWIAFYHRPEGTLLVDEGAGKALLERGKSLLPIGIRDVIGDFKTGAVVNIQTPDGAVPARGLVEYPSDDIRKIKGKKSAQIERLHGERDYDEVIHRDNMVLL